jgi:tRNA dimethylallyltransferase
MTTSSEAPSVLALFGPTAAGKSVLAHALALSLGGEVIVADPFQRYRGLEIAADSPRAPQRAEVSYHLVGDLSVTEGSTAGDYATAAHAIIDDILERGRVPILAGGTGLYLRAALTDLGFPPPAAPATREWAEQLVAEAPAEARRELARRDPASADRIDLANPRRLARALELSAIGGSEARPVDRLWTTTTRHPTVLIAVTRPRPVLDEMILTRVRRELDEGLVAEIEAVIDTPDVSREALQIIGAAEVQALAAGQLDATDLPERLAARTRRLARRQLAWLRHTPGAIEIDLEDAPALDALPALLTAWAERGAPAT